MWFRRNGSARPIPVGKRIFCYVLVAHCSVIIFLLLYHKFFNASPLRRTIAVRTVYPQTLSSAVGPSQPQKTGARLPPSPLKEKKKPSVKATAEISAPRKNPLSAKGKNSALPLTDKAVSPPAPPFEVKIPELIKQTPSSPAPLRGLEDVSYHQKLTQFLQQRLQLPEIGSVQLRLSVNAHGEIIDVEILEAKSSKNAAWLKQQLHHLSLPEFPQFGILESILDFTITFHNVENS